VPRRAKITKPVVAHFSRQVAEEVKLVAALRGQDVRDSIGTAAFEAARKARPAELSDAGRDRGDARKELSRAPSRRPLYRWR
jgi:hypothetical protein